MSNVIHLSTPSVERASALMGGYACADAGTDFAGRVRITATPLSVKSAAQLPGTQVWSPPT